MRVKIQFETGKPSYKGKGLWTLTKEFSNKQHMDNFIDYICRAKGYLLDEVWILDRHTDEGQVSETEVSSKTLRSMSNIKIYSK